MPKKIEVEAIVKTDSAVKSLDKLEDKLEDLAKAADKATDETKSLGQEVGESGAAIGLLDQVTGGLASKVRDLSEVYKTFRGRIQGVTAAQLKANLAFLANPIVLVGAAVAALTLAFAKYASKLTDDVVPVTTTLKNMFLSLGNAADFARRQGEAYTEAMTDKQVKQTERAIQVLKAYGQDTIDLEIENIRRRMGVMEKGTEEYFDAQTQLSVLLAQKDVQETEKARQAKLAEIQEQERVEQERKDNEALLAEFDKGANEAIAYAEGRLFGEEQVKEDPRFEFIDLNKDEEDPELVASLERNQRLVDAEKDKNEKLKAARQDLFLNLASIFGAESKLGRAMLVAKQIQNARELALDISKTIAFSKGALARSITSVAEGSAQTAKIGFPQNIPMLIGYAAQAAGIISAIKQSVSKDGIDVATPTFVPASMTNRPEIVQTLPQVSPVGASGISQLAETISGQQRQPVRAYVVSGDVTSAQSLDRNIISNASI
jgi:hypothetical protein